MTATLTGHEFDHGLLGHHCWLELANGGRVELPVERWSNGCHEGDGVLLDAFALHRSVFDRIPGEGRWRHVLLADGNIGIGGDPAVLLRRTAELIAPDGDVLVELEAPGHGVRHERVRLRPSQADTWFSWAWVGAEAIADVAAEADLRVVWTTQRDHRWFAGLKPC